MDGGSIHDDDSPGGMSRVVEQGLHEFEVVVAYIYDKIRRPFYNRRRLDDRFVRKIRRPF